MGWIPPAWHRQPSEQAFEQEGAWFPARVPRDGSSEGGLAALLRIRATGAETGVSRAGTTYSALEIRYRLVR
jgi:hypothetical protein